MTYDEFILLFPEFDGRTTEDNYNALNTRAILQNDSFQGLPTEKANYAIALYTAYLLENAYPKTQMGGKGAIKVVESFNQKVEFAVNNSNAFDLSSNVYGVQLQDFLNGEYLGGFYV